MLLRDEEDGRGDKEPAPPPSHFLFVALSPSPLVTHDYALSTANQVLLFACNSTTISVNLCRAANAVDTVAPLHVLHMVIMHTPPAPIRCSQCRTYTLLIIIYIFP